MFKITIEGETLEAFHANLQQLAAQFGGVPTAAPAPKPTRGKGKVEPVAEVPEDKIAIDEDDDLDAELNAPVDPAPEGANQTVDAGTGKPAGKAPAATGTVQMTLDDVRKAAAKLSVKDTPKLAEILGKYDAAKLSEVPPEKLGDFAGDVMEALG